MKYIPVKDSVLKGDRENPQSLHFIPVVAKQVPLALSNPGAFGTFLAEKYVIAYVSAKKCILINKIDFCVSTTTILASLKRR